MKRYYGSNTNANKASGIYRGIVENNKDPYKIGRIKVRIPNFHGVPGQSSSFMVTDDLPWAFPCFPSAGADHGMMVVPEVGDTVWVLFENSDRESPVYIGASYAIGSGPKTLSSEGNDTFKSTNGSWTINIPEDESEVPIEYLNDSQNVKVIYKSPKGAIIYINEEDGNESVNIIDRSGQIIQLSSPMSEGSPRRSDGSILNEDDLPKDNFKGSGQILIQTRGNPDNLRDDSFIKLRESLAMISNGLNYLELRDDGIHIKSDIYLDETEYIDDYDPETDDGSGVHEVEVVTKSTRIGLGEGNVTPISSKEIIDLFNSKFDY